MGAFGDSEGNDSDGSRFYHHHIPANSPAKEFWWEVFYDPRTRCELQTSQMHTGKNDNRDELIVNADGSIDNPKIGAQSGAVSELSTTRWDDPAWLRSCSLQGEPAPPWIVPAFSA